MNIKIRKSIPDDVFGIRDVQRETWFATYPNREEGITFEDIQSVFGQDDTPEGKIKIEKRKKRYKDKNINIWVAENKEGIIGFCMAVKEVESNRIGAIYVLPPLQGKGLGGLLVKRALNWLGDQKDIFVNVARYNQQAIGFYKKFGFVETGKEGVFDDAAKLPSGKVIPEIILVRSTS